MDPQIEEITGKPNEESKRRRSSMNLTLHSSGTFQ